jgi:cell division septal protein FtsQ
MKPRRPRNVRLTTEKERRKQYIIRNVVQRGRRVTWRATTKWVGRLCKVLLLAALVAGVYWGATEGYRKLFWENPDYALKFVKFDTDGSLTRDLAISTAGFKEGRNIFSYDLDKASLALKALPQVETADLRRYLPNRIEVAITERKPVAWVSKEGADDPAKAARTHLIDAKGMVFQPRSHLQQYKTLPMIAGLDLGDVAPGKPVRLYELSSALRLLELTRDSGDIKIRSINLAKGYCLVATDQKQTEITFGLDGLEEQLHRLNLVLTEAARFGQDLKTVNVMVSVLMPVTFVPPKPPDVELDELLQEPKKTDGPGTKDAKGATSPKGSKNGATPTTNPRKSEPAREPREPKRKATDSLLQPFRRA